jgi:hypothetical protein
MDNKNSFGGGKLEYVPLSSLRVHPKVQREFDETWGNKIASNWDPLKCEPLAAVRAKTNGVVNGSYLVIDGQHRLFAARTHYGNVDQMLPCWVSPDLELEEQATLFLGWNNTKTVKPFSKWNVRRLAEDETVHAIDTMLKEFGLKAQAAESEGSVRAIAAVENIYTKHGPEILRDTLKILSRAWGTQADAYDNIMIRGLSFVVLRVGKAMEHGEMARKMARHGLPMRFVGEARQLAKISGTSAMRAMAEILVNLWNKGKREQSILKL